MCRAQSSRLYLPVCSNLSRVNRIYRNQFTCIKDAVSTLSDTTYVVQESVLPQQALRSLVWSGRICFHLACVDVPSSIRPVFCPVPNIFRPRVKPHWPYASRLSIGRK